MTDMHFAFSYCIIDIKMKVETIYKINNNKMNIFLLFSFSPSSSTSFINNLTFSVIIWSLLSVDL